jgi:hypothetical protein
LLGEHASRLDCVLDKTRAGKTQSDSGSKIGRDLLTVLIERWRSASIRWGIWRWHLQSAVRFLHHDVSISIGVPWACVRTEGEQSKNEGQKRAQLAIRMTTTIRAI